MGWGRWLRNKVTFPGELEDCLSEAQVEGTGRYPRGSEGSSAVLTAAHAGRSGSFLQLSVTEQVFPRPAMCSELSILSLPSSPPPLPKNSQLYG